MIENVKLPQNTCVALPQLSVSHFGMIVKKL